jgi:predicted permease
MALGAGRWRIVRQLLIESLMLSSIGGILAWWMLKWGVRTYELADRSWRVLDYSMDYRVFGYLVVISMATGVLFGLAPAFRLSRLDVNTSLKEGGRGATDGGRSRRLSSLLVIAEMALAVVLLAGAGIMVRSFLTIYTANLGVKSENILALQLGLPDVRYARPEAKIAFLDRLTARLAAIPGVESVALANNLPAARSLTLPYELEGAAPIDATARPTISAMIAGPGYFQTLGATLRAGREFTDFDSETGERVVIVNERFATQYWPGEEPLGKRLRLFDKGASAAWLTVVGVVSNIVQNGAARQQFDALVYLPYRQRPVPGVEVFARTRIAPASLATAFRQEVQALDADLPVGNIWTLDQWLQWPALEQSNFTALFVVFALVALVLASVGLYAVIAHAVSQRTQEIGVRMAIGATTGEILRMVLRQGLPPVAAGLTTGIAAALALTPSLKSVLVQVSPADPLTYLVASAVLVVSALLGCWIPARRAMRVDPLVALRHD